MLGEPGEVKEALVQARPDSRLLKTQWTAGEVCALVDFVWTGQGFRSLGRRTAPKCPDWGDAP